MSDTESLWDILKMDGKLYRKGKIPLSKLIKQYEPYSAWYNSVNHRTSEENKVVEEFQKELTEHHIKSRFSIDEYLRVENWAREVMSNFFLIPNKKDFSTILEGKEKVLPYLGRDNTKIVIVAGPHNSQTDEINTGLVMYDSGIGDLRIGGRTNVYVGSGDKLHEWGSFAINFHKSMKPKMRKAADDAVTVEVERLLHESNLKNSPIKGHLMFFGYNGRSYDGLLSRRATKNIDRLQTIAKNNPDMEIIAFPMTITLDSVPELDALVNLHKYKKIATAAYIIRDFYEIQKTIKKSMKNDAFSYVHMQIHNPVNIQEDDVKNKIWNPIELNYKITPVKHVSAGIMNVDSNLSLSEKLTYNQIREGMCQVIYSLSDEQLELENSKGLGVDDNFIEGANSLIRDGTIKPYSKGFRILKPNRIKYQANTIKHLMAH